MTRSWINEWPAAVGSGFRRATLEEVDDSQSQQFVKKLRGLAGERPQNVHRAQAHGFSSVPPPDSEGFVLALGGRSSRLIGIGFEHKDKRPRDLPAGGAALYDADGKILKLVKDETDFDAGGKPVTIRNATVVRIEGTTRVSVGVAGIWVNVAAGKVYLGQGSAEETAGERVMTEAGPSDKVLAKL